MMGLGAISFDKAFNHSAELNYRLPTTFLIGFLKELIHGGISIFLRKWAALCVSQKNTSIAIGGLKKEVK
jgi:hypothetical protein